MTLLDVVIFLPLVAFLLILFFPKASVEGIRRFSLLASTVIFVLSLGLIGPYWFNTPGRWTFVTDLPWISSPAIRYHVALDGVSLWLVILATLLTPVCVLVSWKHIDKRVKEFFAFLLLLEFGLVGDAEACVDVEELFLDELGFFVGEVKEFFAFFFGCFERDEDL